MPRKTDPTDVAFGVAVRRRRGQLGLSQNVVARAIGVSVQQVQKYEQGRNAFAWTRIPRLCTVLRCDPNLFAADYMKSVTPSLSPRAIALAGRLEKFSDAELHAIEEVIVAIETAKRGGAVLLALAPTDNRPK